MTNKPSMQRKSSIAPTPSKQPVSKFDTLIFILLSTVCQIWTQVAKKLKPPQTTSWPTTGFLQHNLLRPFVAMAHHSRTYIRLQQQEMMLRVPQLKLSELTWDTGAGSYNIRIAKDLWLMWQHGLGMWEYTSPDMFWRANDLQKQQHFTQQSTIEIINEVLATSNLEQPWNILQLHNI
jgi:hypothetical protein